MLSIGLLIFVSILAFFLSGLAGGGSPFLLLPFIAATYGAAAVAPTITTGLLIANGHRSFLYGQDIDWRVVGWFLPGALIGSSVGAFFLTTIDGGIIHLLIGTFLILSVFSHHFDETKLSFKFKLQHWHLIPFSLFYTILSAIIGSVGAMLIPVCRAMGLRKDAILGTKSAMLTSTHFIKIIAYLYFGVLQKEYIYLGLAIGLTSFLGNWLAKKVVDTISEARFEQVLTTTVLCSGILMIWDSRNLIATGFGH